MTKQMSIPWSKEQLMRANQKLFDKSKRYKQALEFYADEENNYNGINFTVGEWEHMSPVVKDGGEIAKQALKEADGND